MAATDAARPPRRVRWNARWAWRWVLPYDIDFGDADRLLDRDPLADEIARSLAPQPKERRNGEI